MTLTDFLSMGVDEDVSIGDSISVSVGWKAKALGSDARGLVLGVGYNYGSQIAERTLIFFNLSLGIDTNETSDDKGNISLHGRLFHYETQNHNYLLNGTIETKLNAEPFEQYVLGGNSGLKGYPLRYQKGDTRVTFSIEDRLYFDWYPLQLIKFGIAAFAEAGSAWVEGAAISVSD